MFGELTLKERLVLLALDNEKGYVTRKNTAYCLGITGAVIFEMAHQKLIQIKNHQVLVQNSQTTDFCYSKVLQVLQKHSQPPKVELLLMELWEFTELYQQRVFQSLVEKGILKEVPKKLFGIIPLKRFPVINKITELRLRKFLWVLILEDKLPDEENYLLFRFVYHCGLVEDIFGLPNVEMVTEYMESIKKINDATGKISPLARDLENDLLKAVSNVNTQMVLSGG